jgi:hypothetical protein
MNARKIVANVSTPYRQDLDSILFAATILLSSEFEFGNAACSLYIIMIWKKSGKKNALRLENYVHLKLLSKLFAFNLKFNKKKLTDKGKNNVLLFTLWKEM